LQDVPLEIVYRDESLIAINKPAGLLVHRSRIDTHETRFAIQMVRDQIGQRVYPIHRLDKPTSGILLFALDSDMARRMAELFIDDGVEKRYLAVVRGYTPEQDVIDYPLKEELDKMTDARADKNKAAQPAVTEYRRLSTVELPYDVGRYATARYSLLEVIPRTGRKHQIRRHMKHIFHPIVGDTTHGDGKHNRLFRDEFHCYRLLLAATHLSFVHPVSGAKVAICAAVDREYERIIEHFGWREQYEVVLHE
jgi:tRNA pseudouridine65 synthase